VAIPIAVAPADASPYPHHASEDRTDQSEEVFDRDTSGEPAAAWCDHALLAGLIVGRVAVGPAFRYTGF
jgi:hypothetical protein